MNDMYLVENVTSIMMLWSKHRFHFDNLLIYCIDRNTRILNVQTKSIENSIFVVLKILIASQVDDEDNASLDQKWSILNMK